MTPEEVLRVKPAAGVALVRAPNGRTRWVVYKPSPPPPPPPAAVHEEPSPPINLQQKLPQSVGTSGAGRLDLRASAFPGSPHFRLVDVDKRAPSPQNLLLFLHGRGDSHESFAQLGSQMALPQTAVISLRAPRKLPFDLGFTWLDDLDATGDVLPPDMPHAQRSQSLAAARDYVWSFLRTLHETFGWSYSRLFLFGFSQGACVAFHLVMTLPRNVRLGGAILVAGGAIVGPHASAATQDGGAAVTPILQLTGARDEIYPRTLAERSRREFVRKYGSKPQVDGLFCCVERPHKAHAMVDTRQDMQHVMRFFSEHLYLRNVELENRSDVIELHV